MTVDSAGLLPGRGPHRQCPVGSRGSAGSARAL